MITINMVGGENQGIATQNATSAPEPMTSEQRDFNLRMLCLNLASGMKHDGDPEKLIEFARKLKRFFDGDDHSASAKVLMIVPKDEASTEVEGETTGIAG